MRPINGAIFIEYFSGTENIGEFTFDNAIFENQSDATGGGAYDIQLGSSILIPASDINTFSPIPGIVHRYKFTRIDVIDSITLSATIIWDESGDIEDAPTNGSYCIIAEVTSLNKLSLPPLDYTYANLAVGSTLNSILNDFKNIVDKFSRTLSLKSFKTNMLEGQATYSLPELPINSNLIVYYNGVAVAADLNGLDVTVTEYEPSSIESSDELVIWYTA